MWELPEYACGSCGAHCRGAETWTIWVISSTCLKGVKIKYYMKSEDANTANRGILEDEYSLNVESGWNMSVKYESFS